MSLNFGGSSQKQGGTSTVQMPAPSPQQQALEAANLRIANQQAQQMEAAGQQQNQYAASPQSQMDQQNQLLASQNINARLTGSAPVLTPAQQSMLDQAYSSSANQGMTDLARYAQQQAAMRGMSTADSPIGNEALDQLRRFSSDLASRKAGSALDLSNTGANFAQGVSQFGAGLQQQAMQNRLALAATQPASYGLQSNLFGQQLASAPRTTTGNFSGSQNQYGAGLGDLGAAAGGVGGLMRGYASMYPTTGATAAGIPNLSGAY